MSASQCFKAPLPRLHTNAAQAQSRIARHGAAIRASLPDGTEWSLALTPGVAASVYDGACYWADVEWAGARLNIGLPAAGLRAWAAAQAPDLPLGQLPEPLAAAALEALLAVALTGLNGVSSAGPARVTRIHDGGTATLPHGWTVAARAEATGDAAYAALYLDDLGLMLLAGVLAKVPPAENDLDAGSVPVALRAHIGCTELSMSALADLAPGDVVFLDEYRVDGGGELWLVLDNGQALRVRAQASSYVVTQAWTRLMNEPTNSPPDESPAAGADQTSDFASDASGDGAPPVAQAALLDTGTVPVNLSFDLGDRRIVMADLQRLQPGVVFDLQRPLADGPVMIRANGALVGTGDLVDVDGRVGVMVRTLGKAGT